MKRIIRNPKNSLRGNSYESKKARFVNHARDTPNIQTYILTKCFQKS